MRMEVLSFSLSLCNLYVLKRRHCGFKENQYHVGVSNTLEM